MAARSVTPPAVPTGVKRQTRTFGVPTGVKRQAPMRDKEDPWVQVVGIPGAAANVPGNVPFVGPTLDPDVVRARAELGSQVAIATAQGVEPERVAAIAAGQGDPNRGFLGPARAVGGFLRGVGSAITPDKILGVDVSETLEPVGRAAGAAGGAVLRAAAPGLEKLDFGRRLITSAIKEVGDELAVWRGTRGRGETGPAPGQEYVFGAGGFSWDDFVNQAFAGSLGIGKFDEKDPAIIAEAAQYVGVTPKQLADQKNREFAVGGGELFQTVKNPYANQLLGFVSDVVLDPVTWFTGPGGIAKTSAQRAILKGGTKAATRYADNAAILAESAFAKRVAQEAADTARQVGDDAAATAAEQAVKAAEQKAAKAAANISGDAATRQIGRAANQALAESVIQVRDDAQRFLDQATDIIGAPPAGVRVTDVAKEITDSFVMVGDELVPAPGSLGERVVNAGLDADTFAIQYADALRTVEAITPVVIKDIQTSGLAGIAGSYFDIVRGVRTPAQEALGVTGGLRVFNPLSVFGAGPTRAVVPGTQRAMNVAGKLVADSRLGVGRFFPAIVNNITPTGEGGLLGSEDLLRLRTGLRGGRFSPMEAEEATRLISLDNRYRALVQNERKVAAGKLSASKIKEVDRDTLNSVLPYLQSDPATWAGRLPPLTPSQQAAYDLVRNQMDDFYSYAARASGATGFVPPRRANYFPQMQSQEALRWAQRNPEKARDLAAALNVDRTWFLGNFRARDLQPGDVWFGVELTDDDLAQGVVRLNQIAKDSGRIKFDFFETDVIEAMNKYANKHAQFSALQKVLGSIPEQFPQLGARTVGGVAPQTVRGVSRPLYTRPGELPFEELLDPAKLATATPDELRDVLSSAQRVVRELDKPTIIRDEAVAYIDDLNTRLDSIRQSADALPPGGVGTLTDEVAKLVDNIVNEVNGARLTFEGIPPRRWAEYVDVIDDGFIELNQLTTPDIAARAEIAQLFQNAQRMSDIEFAKRARQLAQDYIRFSKTYLTMRPGFHVRNAISNMYQFVAAGGNPVVGRQGVKLQAAINDGIKAGKTVKQVATEIVDAGKLVAKPANSRARLELIDSLEEAINFSGATGFGQFGEIAEELGIGRRGFLATGEPRNIASSAVGSVAQASRKAGTFIENQFRFGLMWDGIMKGLTPQQAAARVNKYLIDYSDFSKADRIARQVFPFWTFMSRNAPLQMEMMFTNPKAYQWYSAFRRNLEDERTEEEGGLIIPSYERERGVFATKEEGFGALLPGTVIRPGLPFEGGGEEILSTLIEDPTKILASVNPLFRAPVEAFLRGERGEKFFTGGKVVPFEESDRPLKSKMTYLVRELASPASPLRSIVAFIPNEQRPEFLNQLLGLTPDDDQANIQELQALLNWTGVPLGNIRTAQQVRELQSRAFEIGSLIDADRARKKKELEKAQKEAERNPVLRDPNINPWETVIGPP